MIRVKINYLEGSALKVCSFDTSLHRDDILEDLGEAAAQGIFYTVMDGPEHVISIAGRCIQNVRMTNLVGGAS